MATELDDAELASLGPAMRSLSPKRRRFVMAMAANPFGSAAEWAREAGYSDHLGADRVAGHHCMHDPRLEDAVMEVAKSSLGLMGPMIAAKGLLLIAQNSDHPKHAWALEAIANRVGLHEVQEMKVVRTDQTGEAMVQRIKDLAGALGLDAAKLLGVNTVPLKVIEHNPDEIRS